MHFRIARKLKIAQLAQKVAQNEKELLEIQKFGEIETQEEFKEN